MTDSSPYSHMLDGLARYAVFAYMSYYPSGGTADLQAAFIDQGEADALMMSLLKGDSPRGRFDNAYVVDLWEILSGAKP